MGNPSKDIPWEKIFSDFSISDHDFDKSPYYISAKEIKAACQDFTKTAEKEVRILCYQAKRSERPKVFEERGLFLLPVKNGHYAIIKGEGYMEISDITSPIISFQSELDFPLESPEIGNSEMQHLDFAHASGLVSHFVGVEKLYLTIRGRKYTPKFEFSVGISKLNVKSVQTEVDAGYEGKNSIVLIEGKNMKMQNTIIRQLFYPYRKWGIDTNKEIIPLFFEKRGDEYMFWMYKFTDNNDYNSIQLVKSARYRIETAQPTIRLHFDPSRLSADLS